MRATSQEIYPWYHQLKNTATSPRDQWVNFHNPGISCCTFYNVSSSRKLYEWIASEISIDSHQWNIKQIMYDFLTVVICMKVANGLAQFGARTSGPWFNIKMLSYQYRKSHCGDKTILRPSYLHNGISHTDKMTSLYSIGALNPCEYCRENCPLTMTPCDSTVPFKHKCP